MKPIKTTKRLYDVDNGKSWATMPYIDALNYKIKLAEKLLRSLPNTDLERIKEIADAIAFNQRLIEECE